MRLYFYQLISHLFELYKGVGVSPEPTLKLARIYKQHTIVQYLAMRNMVMSITD